MNTTLTQCPVCEGELNVTRLSCPQCGVVIDGLFAPETNAFSRLSDEQARFLLSFIRNEGRFNRLEEDLKLSYPTLRLRLAEVIRQLGFEPGREEVAPPKISREERKTILDELTRGAITPQEARARLKGRPVKMESAQDPS